MYRPIQNRYTETDTPRYPPSQWPIPRLWTMFPCPPITWKYGDLCDGGNTLGPVPHFHTRADLEHTRLTLPLLNMVQKGLGQHQVFVEVNNSHLTTLSKTHHSIFSNVSYSIILFNWYTSCGHVHQWEGSFIWV